MSTRPSAIRPAILAMQQNGIGTVSSLGLGNPDIIPLWFGETDLVTPAFSILVVFVLAEVFREGARLRRESELTI